MGVCSLSSKPLMTRVLEMEIEICSQAQADHLLGRLESSGSPGRAAILVANKTDLVRARTVPSQGK